MRSLQFLKSPTTLFYALSLLYQVSSNVNLFNESCCAVIFVARKTSYSLYFDEIIRFIEMLTEEPRDVVMLTWSSRLAPEAVVTTKYDAASDEKVGITITLGFQCTWHRKKSPENIDIHIVPVSGRLVKRLLIVESYLHNILCSPPVKIYFVCCMLWFDLELKYGSRLQVGWDNVDLLIKSVFTEKKQQC